MGELIDALAGDAKGLVVTGYQDILQPSMQEVGKALATTMQFVCTPFTALQFVNDVLKVNLRHKLQKYEEKLQHIPAEQRVVVHPELGVPIIQRLSYTTNEEIADMFISLLTSASSSETLSNAHPSFISIIDRLSPDEARILLYIQQRYISVGKQYIPYLKFRATPLSLKKEAKEGSFEDLDNQLAELLTFVELRNWLTIIPTEVALDFPDKMHIYWANLISCGIIMDMVDMKVEKNEEEYQAIEEFHDLRSLQSQHVPEKHAKVYSSPSIFQITELGRDFIKACVGA